MGACGGRSQKVMIVGLDCAEPSLVLERWRDRLPTLSALAENGVSGKLTSVDPADHRAGLVVHDGEPHARRPRRLRLPEPLRPHLRRRLHRRLDRDPRAAALGSRRPWRRLLGRPRRARHLPAEAAARRHGRLLPHARRLESRYTYPPALRDEIAERVGRLHVRLHRASAPRTRTSCSRQIYEMTDKRFAARGAPRRDEAVAALRDRRDGHRPDPPRLLEVHGRRAPQARARQPATRTRSSTTTSTSTA